MDLPNLFSRPDQSAQPKYFLAMVLTDTTVQTALWQAGPNGITTLQHSKIHSFQDEKNALLKADESLQELGKESENVSDVVFGFEPGWVTSQGIIDTKKPFLKKLTSELSLKPVGYVVVVEALFQSLLRGDPHLSAILILFGETQVTVAVAQRGKLTQTETVGHSEAIVSDVIEALARFTRGHDEANLPPKVLVGSIAVEQETVVAYHQLLVKHDWVKTAAFAHPPTIDVLPETTVLDCGVTEGGRAVAQAQGVMEQPAAAHTPMSAHQVESASLASLSASPLASTKELKEIAVADELKDQTPSRTLSFGLPMAGFGVAMGMGSAEGIGTDGQQIGLDSELGEENPSSSPHGKRSRFTLPNLVPFFARFVKKKPVAHTASPEKDEEKESHKVHHFDGAHHPDGGHHPEGAHHHVKDYHHTFDHPRHHRTMAGVGFASGLMALILLGFFWLQTSKRALAQVVLTTQPVTGEVALTLDPSLAQSDPDKLLLKVDLLSKEMSGEQTIETTGIKLVGEKAKGKVTLLNKTDGSRTFPAGTKLISGNLAFTIAEEVTIASSSVNKSGDSETKVYGKTDVAVTASQIGAESNLAKGAELQIADVAKSSYSATAVEAFAGGASREVRVVSPADRDKVLKDLQADLVKKAQTAYQQEAGSGRFVVPTGKVNVLSSKYDGKSGDETKTLSLSLRISVQAAAYAQDEIKPLVAKVLQEKMPSGFQLSAAEPEILSKPIEAASGSSRLQLQANISAQAQPIIDFTAWKKEIAGQSLTSAEAILRGKGEVQQATVTITPKFATLFFRSLPKNLAAITIEPVAAK